jgi:hypothetical protein
MIVSPFSAKNSTEEDVQRISKVFDRDNTKGTTWNDKLGASCGTLVTLISFPSMGSH